MISVCAPNGPQTALMHNTSSTTTTTNWNPSYPLQSTTSTANPQSTVIATDSSAMLGHQQAAPTNLASSPHNSYPGNYYSSADYQYALTKTDPSYVPRRSGSDVYTAVNDSTRDPLFNQQANTTTVDSSVALSAAWAPVSTAMVSSTPPASGLPSLPPLSEALHQIQAEQQQQQHNHNGIMTTQPQSSVVSSLQSSSRSAPQSTYYASLAYNDVAAPYVTADGLMIGGMSDTPTAAPIIASSLGPAVVVPGMLPQHLAVVQPTLLNPHSKYLHPNSMPMSIPNHRDDDDDAASSSSIEHQNPPQKVFSFVSLPGINTKKRPRRRFEEIERHYACNWGGCTKSYGTLNHLNAHVQMQKHGPKRHPSEFKELRKQWRRQKREEEERRAADQARKERDTQEALADQGDRMDVR